MDINTILASGEYTMLLVRAAKKYILNGGNPAACTKCLRDYHKKIIMKAELLKKIEERTCVPSFKGKMYIPTIVKNGKSIAVCYHIASEYLTDDQAIKYLKEGALKNSHFSVLPKGLRTEKKIEKKVSDTKKKID